MSAATTVADSPATQIAKGCRVLGIEDQGDPVWGHVSLRDPDERGVWMKAGPRGFDEVTEDDVVLIDFSGNVLVGDHRVPLEYPLHTEVLKARPEISSVVHTHPPHAIALSATDHPLRVFSNSAGPFAGGVPRFELPVGMIDTEDLGRELADCLGQARALFMVGHGITVPGTSVATSVTAAVLLERACRIQLLAAAAGGVSSALENPGDRYRHAETDGYLLRSWEYLIRSVWDESASAKN